MLGSIRLTAVFCGVEGSCAFLLVDRGLGNGCTAHDRSPLQLLGQVVKQQRLEVPVDKTPLEARPMILVGLPGEVRAAEASLGRQETSEPATQHSAVQLHGELKGVVQMSDRKWS